MLYFRECRFLILKQSMDFSDVVLQTLKEMNACSKAMSRSVSDIENHILWTYDIKVFLINFLNILIISKDLFTIVNNNDVFSHKILLCYLH